MEMTALTYDDDARILGRIEAGMQWLDRVRSDWVAPVAAAMGIDAGDPFSLVAADRCVLGTVFGDFNEVVDNGDSDDDGLPRLSNDKAMEYAFLVDAVDQRQAEETVAAWEDQAISALYAFNGWSDETIRMFRYENYQESQRAVTPLALAWLRIEFWWRLAIAKRLGMIG